MENMRLTFVIASALIITLFSGCKSSQTDVSAIPIGLKVGERAPDIAEVNPQGDTLRLSNLRGNIVLIDFWASWCGPCRRANPGVVKMYEEFQEQKFQNAKGFTIFSVSLDQHKAAWIKAIEDDNLSWDSHVSDLKGWKSKTGALYKVSFIPQTVLIDSRGVIVGRNLQKDAIHTYLQGQLK